MGYLNCSIAVNALDSAGFTCCFAALTPSNARRAAVADKVASREQLDEGVRSVAGYRAGVAYARGRVLVV